MSAATSLPAFPPSLPGAGGGSHASPALAEADRLMTVCNSCRYCEGLCAVFPAMELRRSFGDADLNYLANLCHNCGACYADCQFSPPHPFAVNVPATLAAVREQSWAHYARPALLAPLFDRGGAVLGWAAAAAIAGFLIGFAPDLFTRQTGAGAFYRFMPHDWMAGLFGAALAGAVLALAAGVRAFWRDAAAAAPSAGELAHAGHDAATLRYLDGGGAGCMTAGLAPSRERRVAHHLTFYGFLLCLASTSVATLYHYGLGREAPYPWWDLPVVLGTLGGIGLVVGSLGLLRSKWRRDPARASDDRGLGTALTLMLLALGVTGLLLLLLRATPAMGTLLAIHLGTVFGFFVTLPYGKFVHGLYRTAALVRYARERKHS